MADYITKAQYDELAELESFGFDRKGWNKKLKEYTGIVGGLIRRMSITMLPEITSAIATRTIWTACSKRQMWR